MTIPFRPIPAVAALGSALFPATAAFSQGMPCMAREQIVSLLSDTYAEQLIGRGLQSDVRLVEIFTSEDGDSWTLVQTFPSGISCIMATGQSWLPEEPSYAVESRADTRSPQSGGPAKQSPRTAVKPPGPMSPRAIRSLGATPITSQPGDNATSRPSVSL